MTASPPGHGAVSSGEGVVAGVPRRWLGLEGLVLLAGALIAFGALGQPWWPAPPFTSQAGRGTSGGQPGIAGTWQSQGGWM
jgi:hypothetical protein